MAKKDEGINIVGSSAFVLALLLAVILGALDLLTSTVSAILVLLGLIIGLLNVQDKESHEFLIAGTVLVIVSSLGGPELGIIPAVERIFVGLLFVFVPSTAVVALREMLELAKQ